VFRFRSSTTLGTVAPDLKRAGGGLRAELTKELRPPTKGVYDAVRNEVLTGSMAGRRVPGARKRFPASVGAGNHVRRPALSGLSWKVSTSAGNPRAEVTWNPSAIAARIRALFPYLVGQKTRLRHPVIHRSVWVGQNMPNAWGPTRRLAAAAQQACGKALDTTAAIIGGRR
jgi:hypothetical protein